MRKIRFFMAVLTLLVAAVPGAALADHDDGVYEMPTLDQWTKSHLNVLIVPPSHGQVYNQEGPANGGDPNEATPFNSYLRAVEDSIEEWNNGIEMFGSKKLKEVFRADVYVLGRDEIPSQATMDIVVTTDENKGPVLGFALRVEPCIVNNSKFFVQSYTYSDMYNVNAQEYGHCLGLQHVGSQGGADPTSDQKHPEHDVLNGFYADDVGGAGTHLHCVSNMNVKGLEYTFKYPRGTFEEYVVYMPVAKYRTTCGGDGKRPPKP